MSPSEQPEEQLKGPDGTPIIKGPDGILEYDNPMPRWMAVVFIGTIIWGVGYLVLFPGAGMNLLGFSQYKNYEAEVAEAKTQFASAQSADPKALLAAAVGNHDAQERGEAVFKANCAACHGPKGKGAIGPNLTDAAWLYGGKPEEIIHTISEGTAKGMPTFKNNLSPAQLADLTAYVQHLSADDD